MAALRAARISRVPKDVHRFEQVSFKRSHVGVLMKYHRWSNNIRKGGNRYHASRRIFYWFLPVVKFSKVSSKRFLFSLKRKSRIFLILSVHLISYRWLYFSKFAGTMEPSTKVLIDVDLSIDIPSNCEIWFGEINIYKLRYLDQERIQFFIPSLIEVVTAFTVRSFPVGISA
jgi:hypothetical protein